MTIDKARKAVFAEMKRFEEAPPELQKTLQGKWVVFKDGVVHSSHTFEEEAYLAGLDAFGRLGGHVVVQVIAIEPTPLSAGVLFGLEWQKGRIIYNDSPKRRVRVLCCSQGWVH